jgi:hypothetical protein
MNQQVSSKEAPKAKSKDKDGDVEVRLLSDSQFGKANDVVQVPAAMLDVLKENGQVDDNDAAIEYAKTLPQNKKQSKDDDK